MKRILLFIILLLLCDQNVSAEEITVNNINMVGATTTSSEVPAKDYIIQCMLDKQATIDLSSYELTTSDIRSIYGEIINYTPELFYIDNSYSVNLNTSTGYINTLSKFYYYELDNHSPDLDAIASKQAEIDSIVSSIQTTVDTLSTDYEKLLYIHDFIVENVSYDYSSILKYGNSTGYFPKTDFDMYGALIEGTAVCQGYSHAFKYICDSLGLCTNDFAYNTEHIWNQVYLNGEYYNIDCTYDDYMYDIYMKVQHANFLKSDAQFGNNHSSYVGSFKCDSTLYDNVDSDGIITHLCRCDDTYYYLRNSVVMQANVENNQLVSDSTGITLSDAWVYSNICMYDDNHFFYNTKNSIKLYNMETDKSTVICNVSNKNIFGVAFEGSRIIYGYRYYTIVDNSTAENRDTFTFNTEHLLTVAEDNEDGESEEEEESNPVKYVKISSNSVTIPKSGKMFLTAKYYPTDADDFESMEWKSSNKKVATVSQRGVVTAKKAGTATITVTVNDSISATCKVTVYNYGLTKINGKYYYYTYSGKKIKKQWKTVKGKKYYFNKKGQAVTGWQKIKGKKYYFSKKGVMQTGWKKIGKYKYYFNKKGIYKKKVKL